MTLTQRLKQLCEELRATSVDIRYHRQGCAVSEAIALELSDMAEEMEEFALVVDIEQQDSMRH